MLRRYKKYSQELINSVQIACFKCKRLDNQANNKFHPN
jgi:hypothetical protein